jgi:4'-phosphopantetheinyl transferase EntD
MPFGLLSGVHLPRDAAPVALDVLEKLHVEERQHASTLAGHRQVEWVGGRLALHRAIRQLGVRSGPILTGSRGEPLLPPGISASVSHKRGLAVALAARQVHGTLGLDLEDLGPPRPNIARMILRPEELKVVDELTADRRWVAILLRFALKEAVYKALHPHLNRYVGFQEASVSLSLDGTAEVTLDLKEPAPPFLVSARFQWLEERVLATVRIQPGPTDQAPTGPTQDSGPVGDN